MMFPFITSEAILIEAVSHSLQVFASKVYSLHVSTSILLPLMCTTLLGVKMQTVEYSLGLIFFTLLYTFHSVWLALESRSLDAFIVLLSVTWISRIIPVDSETSMVLGVLSVMSYSACVLGSKFLISNQGTVAEVISIFLQMGAWFITPGSVGFSILFWFSTFFAEAAIVSSSTKATCFQPYQLLFSILGLQTIGKETEVHKFFGICFFRIRPDSKYIRPAISSLRYLPLLYLVALRIPPVGLRLDERYTKKGEKIDICIFEVLGIQIFQFKIPKPYISSNEYVWCDNLPFRFFIVLILSVFF